MDLYRILISNKVLIQWGKQASVTDQQVITLTNTFTKAWYDLQLTTYASSTTAAYSIHIKSKTISNFTILKREEATEGIFYLAIGY